MVASRPCGQKISRKDGRGRPSRTPIGATEPHQGQACRSQTHGREGLLDPQVPWPIGAIGSPHMGEGPPEKPTTNMTVQHVERSGCATLRRACIPSVCLVGIHCWRLPRSRSEPAWSCPSRKTMPGPYQPKTKNGMAVARTADHSRRRIGTDGEPPSARAENGGR